MPIEFHCPQCDHFLRTSADKAGLSAKCPACGEAIWVPQQSEAPRDAAAGPGAPPPLLEQAEDRHAAEPAPERREPGYRRPLHCPVCGSGNSARAKTCSACGYQFRPEDRDADEGWNPPRLDIGEVFSTTWTLYTRELGTLIGCVFVEFLLFFAIALLLVVPIIAVGVGLGDEAPIVIGPAIAVAILLFVPFAVLVGIGHVNLFLRAARGEPVSVGNLFYGFGEGRRFFGRMLVLSICLGLLMLVGTILCILPGVIVSWLIWPAARFLIDRDLSAGDAMGVTYEEVKRDLGTVLIVGLVAWGIGLLAGFIPYLGVILMLFTFPFCELLYSVAYLRLTAQRTAADY